MIGKSLFIFLFASFLIHFSFFSSLLIFDQSKNNKSQPITIDFVSKKPTQKRQLVDQAKQINDEVPDENYYLGKNNQTVTKQMKAQNHGKFKNSTGNSTQSKNSQRLAKKKSLSKPGKMPSLSALAPKLDIQNLSNGIASQTDDYLKDVEAGSETLLSTREFVYYSYYTRIKNKLRRHWGRKVRKKVHNLARKGRNIASVSDRITKVIIILNNKGTLINVQVVSQSGVIDLDDAAIEAFKEAAPFPNPPNGMIERDGHVRIYWDFILEA